MELSLTFIREMLYVLFSYLVGSILTGYLLIKYKYGADIRLLGSGTIGARNAGRLYGIGGFCITFIGDAAKGALVMGMAKYVHPSLSYSLLVLLAVLLGHLYPLFLSFRGGKGMSTFCGGALFLHIDWYFMMFFATIFILLLTRSFTIAGLFGVFILPFLIGYNVNNWYDVFLASLIAGSIIYAHRNNISRIWNAGGI